MASSVAWMGALASKIIDYSTFQDAVNELPLTDEAFFPIRGKIEK